MVGDVWTASFVKLDVFRWEEDKKKLKGIKHRYEANRLDLK